MDPINTVMGIVLYGLAIIVYLVLFIFTIIGVVLYRYAYKNMKRSRIIGAVWTMFIALAIDTGWWLATTLSEFHANITYDTILTGAIPIIIIKGLLALGLIRFIVYSIRDDSIKTNPEEEAQEKLF